MICGLCDGDGCEEGCGQCEMAHAGPDSHKVCRRCGGTGEEPIILKTKTISREEAIKRYG